LWLWEVICKIGPLYKQGSLSESAQAQCELCSEEFLGSRVHAKTNQIDPITGKMKAWILINLWESE